MVRLTFLLPTLLLLALSLCFPPAANARELVIVALDSAPLEYPAKDNIAAGRNVEIAREALRRMGQRAVFLFVPWQRALRMVSAGTADAVLDAGRTPEREAYLFYPSENIYVERIAAFALAARDLRLDPSLRDVGDLEAGVGRGHYYGPVVDAAVREGRFRSVQAVPYIPQNVDKLLKGRIDVMFAVRDTMLHALRGWGLEDRIAVVRERDTDRELVLSAHKTYLAFSRVSCTEEMAAEFTRALRAMKADGCYEAVDARYR